MMTEPNRTQSGNAVQAADKASRSFHLHPLTKEERAALKVDRYYRPYTVNRDKVLKSRRSFWLVKRIVDVILAALALIVLSPLILVTMLLIFIEDPKSCPIYVQDRVGRDGKVFRFYKLRSMYTGADHMLEKLMAQNEFAGKAFKIKEDPRITKVGRVIRNLSIDELPQLVNILKGDMTIVGPRPPLPREVGLYDDYEKQRLMVTPGLTCLWQIYPHRHEITFDDWVALDIKYIAERTLFGDVKIVLATVCTVLRGNAD